MSELQVERTLSSLQSFESSSTQDEHTEYQQHCKTYLMDYPTITNLKNLKKKLTQD